jgi:FHA domain
MATYLPDPTATWFAAVRGAVVLMVPASASAELAALWPDLADGDVDPTSLVLDRLTAGGVAATPSFALVVRDAAGGSARVVVRGELTVRADGSEVSGSGVSTWTERVVESEAFDVAVSGGSTAESALPVVEAVVPAMSVRSEGIEQVAPAPTTAASVAPERAAAPVVVPEPATVPEPPVMPAAVPVTIPFPPVPPAAAAEQTMVPAEDTIAGPSTPAQPLPAFPAPGPVSAAAPALDGDHDGLTVASIDLRRLRAERAARSAEETPASGLPAVVDAPPGPAASLRMPDGALEPIGHDVVLGRAPSVSQVSGGRLPRLITIGVGDPDISRSHVRVAVEGDTVVITDLHSRNGTHVVAPGKPPVKLRAGEPTPVLAGTVVDLGGGWTVQVVGA